MSTHNILLAGFGGQGILFAGKLLAYAGMLSGKEISWLPSYGPETRGGTSNCSVIVSDEPVGSPLVTRPNVLIVMNGPSYDKFEPTVEPGGIMLVNDTLINAKSERDDIKSFYIPATRLADENNMSKLANVIICGKLIRETGMFEMSQMPEIMAKCVSSTKKELVELNMKALEIGYNL